MPLVGWFLKDNHMGEERFRRIEREQVLAYVEAKNTVAQCFPDGTRDLYTYEWRCVFCEGKGLRNVVYFHEENGQRTHYTKREPCDRCKQTGCRGTLVMTDPDGHKNRWDQDEIPDCYKGGEIDL